MDQKEGFLLIGTSMIILLALVLSVLAVMLIYRRRKLDHTKEVNLMNEHFAKEMLNTQLEIQQQTMQQIGREIHDNVGQKLTLASLYVQQLDLDKHDAFVQKKITAVTGIINESLSDLRSLSKNLTDTQHAGSSLYDLVNKECARINAAGTCTAGLHANTKQMPVSLAIKNFVLRTLQEFMQNSLKHAACTVINIRLQLEEDGLHIEATDNGRGFVTGTEARGIGLKNMARRAEIIGARFVLTSTPGSGTNMQLVIPATKFNI